MQNFIKIKNILLFHIEVMSVRCAKYTSLSYTKIDFFRWDFWEPSCFPQEYGLN